MTTGEAPTILVADDNEQNRRLLEATFRAEGWRVRLASDGESALDSVASERPAIVLMDLRMPGIGGLEALVRLRVMAPEIPVLMLTAHGEISAAVEATKRGAYDFLTRPIDGEELVMRVRRALEHGALEREVQSLRRGASPALARIVGTSAVTRGIVSRIRQLARAPMTVLVLGETGTGKELVARAIHHESDRAKAPFIAIDCGAIPENLLEPELFGHEKGAFSGADSRREGRFVQARGGTVFLDEIGNLPVLLQAKLLRVLQEKEVQPLGAKAAVSLDVRFVAATNEALDARIESGRFREDLYYRLAEATIEIPPLRARGDDVLDLARHFLEEAAVELRRAISSISPDAMALLREHRWPGNARELRNTVRQAVLNADGSVVEARDIAPLLARRSDRQSAPKIAAPGAGARPLREVAEAACAVAERQAIIDALRSVRGNKTKAAKLLDVDFKTLSGKMKKLGIGSDGDPDTRE